MMNLTYSNPKNPYLRKSMLYRYYAGFSEEFVKDILEIFVNEEMTVLDPWNGSGTTTKIGSQYKNINLIGLDINPAMGVIARAQLFRDKRKLPIKYNFKKIYRKNDIVDDPLENWFTQTTVANIRNIEIGLRDYLKVGDIQRKPFIAIIDATRYSSVMSDPEASFVYLALFSVLKKLVKKFKGSNPTWIKIAKEEKEKIYLSQKKLEDLLETELDEMQGTVNREEFNSEFANVNIDTANSISMTLEDDSVDLVVTSPPYCTRIDYVVATRVELAVLGVGNKDNFEQLRNNMIGTTKVIDKEFHKNVFYSKTATKFLKNVYYHKSRASKTYYAKQFFQYFESIFLSVKELSRVCKNKSKAVIVIQDSFYKDIYLDIFQVFKEIFSNCGWELIEKSDFKKQRTLAGVNKESRKYRKDFSATESVLIFEKGE